MPVSLPVTSAIGSTMPEMPWSVASATVRGQWRGQNVRGTATLVLGDYGGVLHGREGGARIEFAYPELFDASVDRASITLYVGRDLLSVAANQSLEDGWRHLLERACPIPEVARSMPSLKRRDERGEPFFQPLFSALSKLIVAESLDRRVAAFGARNLVRHYQAYPTTWRPPALTEVDPPALRSAEAHAEEAVEPLVAALEALGSEASDLVQAPVGERFVAWRRWSDRLLYVFTQADRAWLALASEAR